MILNDDIGLKDQAVPTPGEHKTLQYRILAYAQEMGWHYVSRIEAEACAGIPRSLPPSP